MKNNEIFTFCEFIITNIFSGFLFIFIFNYFIFSFNVLIYNKQIFKLFIYVFHTFYILKIKNILNY